MDFNRLRTFVEVAQCNSITRAADNLNRTQQAISVQMKQLEEETELALFERHGPRILLTQEGEILYQQASIKLQDIEDTIVQIKHDAQSAEGTIRIGSRVEQGDPYLPTIVSKFRNKYTKARFQISVGSEQDLLANKIDFGLFLFTKEKKLLEIHEVLTHELILVGEKTYLEKHPRITCFEGILEHDIIDFNVGYLGLRTWLRKNAKHLLPALKRTPTVTVRNSALLKEILVRGAGLCVLPKRLIEKELASGALVQIMPKQAQSAYAYIDIACKKKRTFSLIHEEFLKFVLMPENLWTNID